MEKQGLTDGNPFGLYPNEEAIKLDEEIMKDMGLVFFYCALVRKQSWERSFQKVISKGIPWYIQKLGVTPEKLTQEKREKIKKDLQIRATELGFDSSKGEEAYDAMTKIILTRYENMLIESKSSGPFLLSHKVSNPSVPIAADCALFAFLQRIYGNSGDANFPSSWPELLNDYPEMQRYFKEMNEKYPIQFKGKRRPEGSPRLPITQLYSKPKSKTSLLLKYIFG